jgi:1,4-dihydroxy-2-naphthoate octaprenyltransferase
MSSVKYWIEAARPKTLTAALVPIWVATALAAGLGFKIQIWISVLALLSSFFIQIGTNLVNDYYDFKKGADKSDRLGPRRVTQSGLISEKAVKIGAFASFAIAVAFAVPLVWQGGWVIVTIGVASLLAGYAYTGGPFPLAYRGMGEVFVLIFFGLVAVGGLFFLQTGRFDKLSLIAGAQVGLLATVLIAVNNLRDISGDKRAGKRTVAVRLGMQGARIEIALLCLLPFLIGVYWTFEQLRWATIIPMVALPIARSLSRKVSTTEPSAEYNRFLGQAALLHLVFGALLGGAFFIYARH